MHATPIKKCCNKFCQYFQVLIFLDFVRVLGSLRLVKKKNIMLPDDPGEYGEFAQLADSG